MKKILKYFLIKYNIISENTFTRMRKHLVRVVCDEEIIKYLHSIDCKNLETLEISGNRWKKIINSEKYDTISYPDIDLEKKTEHLKKYDIIILEHILEHVSNPRLALINIFKLLKSGGRVIIVTPFLIKTHNAPIDCTRWTKNGLKNLLQQIGFEKNKITVGQWGNRSAVIANFKTWVKYNPLKHSLNNEENFPVVVWAFAQK